MPSSTLLWLAIVAVAAAWIVDRLRLAAQIRALRKEVRRLTLFEAVRQQVEQLNVSVTKSYFVENTDGNSEENGPGPTPPQ